VRSKFNNWSDAMDDEQTISVQKFLPTAPRAARGNDVDESRIPREGPFIANLSNLHYDVVESDIVDFFAELHVSFIIMRKSI